MSNDCERRDANRLGVVRRLLRILPQMDSLLGCDAAPARDRDCQTAGTLGERAIGTRSRRTTARFAATAVFRRSNCWCERLPLRDEAHLVGVSPVSDFRRSAVQACIRRLLSEFCRQSPPIFQELRVSKRLALLIPARLWLCWRILNKGRCCRGIPWHDFRDGVRVNRRDEVWCRWPVQREAVRERAHVLISGRT